MQRYFEDFFKSNNIRKIWKGIKSVVSMKRKSNNDSPTSTQQLFSKCNLK